VQLVLHCVTQLIATNKFARCWRVCSIFPAPHRTLERKKRDREKKERGRETKKSARLCASQPASLRERERASDRVCMRGREREKEGESV